MQECSECFGFIQVEQRGRVFKATFEVAKSSEMEMLFQNYNINEIVFN